jgi:hypothetical protein
MTLVVSPSAGELFVEATSEWHVRRREVELQGGREVTWRDAKLIAATGEEAKSATIKLRKKLHFNDKLRKRDGVTRTETSEAQLLYH